MTPAIVSGTSGRGVLDAHNRSHRFVENSGEQVSTVTILRPFEYLCLARRNIIQIAQQNILFIFLSLQKKGKSPILSLGYSYRLLDFLQSRRSPRLLKFLSMYFTKSLTSFCVNSFPVNDGDDFLFFGDGSLQQRFLTASKRLLVGSDHLVVA